MEGTVTDVSHYSIHSAPRAVVFLMYFDVILIVHLQNECIYLGKPLNYKLVLINTDESSPTKLYFGQREVPLTKVESTYKPMEVDCEV